MQDIITLKMTDEERATAIQWVKKLIKADKLTFEHADPSQEYCYTSTSAYIGLYFPNSAAKIRGDSVICAAKVGGSLGLIYSHEFQYIKKDPESFFESFENLYFSRLEKELFNSINKSLNYYKNMLDVAQNIQFVTTKKGEPFANLLKNIDTKGADGSEMHYYMDNCGNLIIYKSLINQFGYKVHTESIHFYPSELQSLDDLKKAIQNEITTAQKEIAKYTQEVKDVKKIAKKIEDFKKALATYSYQVKEVAKKEL